MLTHLGCDVGVFVFGQFIEALNRILRLDRGFRTAIGQTVLRLPCLDFSQPRRDFLCIRRFAQRFPFRKHILQHACAIAHNTDIDAHILIDRRWINIDMDLFRMWRERIQPTRDTVIKTRTDADHHIAIMHRHIGLVCPVHPEHAEPLRISRRKRAQTHQGRGDRVAREAHQFAQQSGSFIA